MKIAIIGSGVSGLVAAYRLHAHHDITVFEANDYVGGHVHTHRVSHEGRYFAIDSGFIVYNEKNYPGFTSLLQELGVATQASFMSFSVQVEQTGLEYNGTNLNTLFAQRRNLLRPAFYGMIREILRFNREAPMLLEADTEPDLTIGEYLLRHRYSDEFIHHYIIPMGASIWSSSPQFLHKFPARPFVQFFHNHGMLSVNDRPQWRVICGGSQSYVKPLIAPFKDRIRLRCPVQRVARSADAVSVHTTQGGNPEIFDRVIFATHSDQAYRLLADPSADEVAILGDLPYQENTAVLHSDARLLPKSKRAWAAWNYTLPRQQQPSITITYNMSILQNLAMTTPLCVTLNRDDQIAPDKVLKSMTYWHPQYTAASFRARQQWSTISGVHNTHYCGAYWGYGFHEDGYQSAQRVVDQILQTEPAIAKVTASS